MDARPLGRPVSIGLDAKLATFDQHAEAAVDDLIGWLIQHRGDLIAVARGRHVLGHLLYEDRNFAEYGASRLRAETAEELADAICYTARRLHLEEGNGDGATDAERAVG